MENNPNPANDEPLRTEKSATAEKFESFKTEAGQHLDAIARHLDQLKDQLVAQAQEMEKDIDVDKLKAQVTQHFEAAKATTAETLTNLQAQAETIYAEASANADVLKDVAEDKYDELQAEAAVRLQAAQVRLDELKAEAILQIEEVKEKVKGVWHQLFDK